MKGTAVKTKKMTTKQRKFERQTRVIVTCAYLLTSTEAMCFPPRDFSHDFIRIVKSNNQTENAYAVTHVDKALKALPEKLKNQLHSYGVKIVIAPSVVDYRPELIGKIPAGYKRSHDYRYMGGEYRSSTREIILGIRVEQENQGMILNKRIGSTALHELGHAVDHMLMLPSRKSKFAQIYKGDCSSLKTTQLNRDRYYLLPNRGASELFAELFLFCYHQKAGFYVSHSDLPKDFPGCYRFMQHFITSDDFDYRRSAY